jgi:inner membrane protein
MEKIRQRLRRRLWASDGEPGALAWVIASVSLVLPVVGVGLVLIGGAGIARGADDGWTWLGIGAFLIGLDIVIDFAWAHPGLSISDQPDLNRRGAQLIGRIVDVAEAIVGGRGKVKVGDTLWTVEGPDTHAGTPVRVASSDGTVLRVEAVEQANSAGC